MRKTTKKGLKSLEVKREKIKGYKKKYNHTLKGKLAHKKYEKTDKFKQSQRRYSKTEKCRICKKKYRDKHKEEAKEFHSKYRRLHLDKYRYYQQIRRSLELGAIGSHTFEEWELLKKQYNFTCPCCHRKEPKIFLTEDHIIPLSKGGSNLIENIQPLCRSCNCSKHTKIIKYNIYEKISP
jgi:5-methylcytosine-specific restriction endonuclease McrA